MPTCIDANGNYAPVLAHPAPQNFGDDNQIGYVGPPTDDPPQGSFIRVDVNGRVWAYWGGSWN